MSEKIGRNDPCPCGSGKKYKHCHLGATDDPGHRELPQSTEEIPASAAPAAPMPAWARNLPWIFCAVGILVAAGLWFSGSDGAIAVGGGTVVLTGLWFLLSDPPPPKDDAGDPAALNFGRRD